MAVNSPNSLKPIERVSLADAVAQRILAYIDEGQLKVGDKLPSQKELGDRLKVSHPSLREALSGLIMMGYLEARAGQGFYLRKVPMEQRLDFSAIGEIEGEDRIRSLYEARGAIEAMIAELAAKRATSEDIQKLYDAVKEIEKGVPTTRALEKGLDFHQLVASAAHNPVLAQIENELLSLFLEFVPRLFSETPSYERDVATHLAIVQCIDAHDADRARAASLEHIRVFANEIGITDLGI
jgi:GntR family transcriptional regulator, transcriptional repressor for pyruvate dehydrogenase complex